MSTHIDHHAVSDSYFELVREFPLVSIHSDEQLREASAFLDNVLCRELDKGVQEYVDALTDLIEHYEHDHVVIEAPSDAEILKHLLEAKGVSQAQVAVATGIPKSTISEILSGGRSFNKNHISKLARYFSVDVSVFFVNHDGD